MANHGPLCLSPWRRHNTTIPRLQNPFLHFSFFSLHLPFSLLPFHFFFHFPLFFRFQTNVPFSFFLLCSSFQSFSLWHSRQTHALLYMWRLGSCFLWSHMLSLCCDVQASWISLDDRQSGDWDCTKCTSLHPPIRENDLSVWALVKLVWAVVNSDGRCSFMWRMKQLQSYLPY